MHCEWSPLAPTQEKLLDQLITCGTERVARLALASPQPIPFRPEACNGKQGWGCLHRGRTCRHSDFRVGNQAIHPIRRRKHPNRPALVPIRPKTSGRPVGRSLVGYQQDLRWVPSAPSAVGRRAIGRREYSRRPFGSARFLTSSLCSTVSQSRRPHAPDSRPDRSSGGRAVET